MIQSGGGNLPSHQGQYLPPPNQPQFDHHQAQNISQGVADTGKGVKWLPWAIVAAAFILISPCIGCYGLAIIGSCSRPAGAAALPLSSTEQEVVGDWAHYQLGEQRMFVLRADHTGELIDGPLTTPLTWSRVGTRMSATDASHSYEADWVVSDHIAYVDGYPAWRQVR